MAGDLHIFVCENRQQKSARRTHANYDSKGDGTLDTVKVLIKGYWFDFDFYLRRIGSDIEPEGYKWKHRRDRFEKHLYKGPDVWIGRLSRAGVSYGTETLDEAVPQVCQRVMAIFGRRILVKVTDKLIGDVKAAFDGAQAHPRYSHADVEDVVAFLEAHRGKRAWLS